MQGRRLGALVLIFAACASGCARKPGRDKAIPPAKDPGIALPALDGLGLTKVAALDESDGAPGAEKWLRKVTVDVPAEASPKIMDARDASQWRGVALPRAENGPIPRGPVTRDRPPKPIARITITKEGLILLNDIRCKDVTDFAEKLVALDPKETFSAVILDPNRSAPFDSVLRAMGVMGEQDVDFIFQGPPISEGKPPSKLFACLKREADSASMDLHNMPNVCLRIRPDAAAPYGAVQDVITEGMRHYYWRLSFVGLLDGREVEIGPLYTKPHEPREEPGLEDAISDIPPGGTGVPGIFFDIAYGFRTGGGRRRATLRGGGSRRSENAVDRALEWLRRHQEEDGRWSAALVSAAWAEPDVAAAKSGGVEGMDVAATGLATLTFLSAGHTEKTGRHRNTVVKAVKWLVKQQAGDGRIGGGTARPGLQNAIAALALAEAYGMARVLKTGAAAQKAVDYSINVHQVKYSGWGYEPKAEPSTHVTGWFVMQLKMSLIAGLRVDGKGFEGAAAWTDSVTEEGTGRVRSSPGKAPSPAATAVAAFGLQLMMGWRRDHPRLVGAADYLAANLPVWKEDADLHYWYWGSLDMFQMGDHWWKMWNAGLRDMLVERQRKGAPDIDGSWDPMGGLLKDTGRVGSTAMAAMCLEVYYRYLPLYK